MEKYDTSQLTEFPRFEAESTQSGVSTFFNKLWKLPLFTPSDGAETPQIKASEDEKQEGSSAVQSKLESEAPKSEVEPYAHDLEVRSLPNVVRRITSLIASGSGVRTILHNYKVFVLNKYKRSSNKNPVRTRYYYKY